MRKVLQTWNNWSLVTRILIGMIVGVVLALTVPETMSWVSIFGELFVGALKAVAPILVLFLVLHAIAKHNSGQQNNMKKVIIFYLIATFSAAFIAVVASFLFPVTLTLETGAEGFEPPGGLREVLETVLFNIVDNPVNALVNANYIGILAWAVLLGLALRKASDATKSTLESLADAVTKVVTWIISLAPIGILGLVFDAIASNGLGALAEYGQLLLLLLGCMFFVALIMNPLIVFIATKRNPYPLVLQSLRESGITAFFTRSSAANIPVNMNLCDKLGVDRNTYSVSIPLGATINMSGAAITISILTLAAVNTLDIQVDFGTAFILSVLAAVSACGASGVAGGSLLLIPLASSLFGIPNDIAMQIVGVGFVIGILQDSCETALNSSSDVVFTAAADWSDKR